MTKSRTDNIFSMETFLSHHKRFDLDPYYETLAGLIREKQAFLAHPAGNFLRYKQVVDAIPDLVPSVKDVDAPAVRAGAASDISQKERLLLTQQLMQLAPWRKGPFDLFGIHVDAEWRSDMKWNRVAPHLPDLTGMRILDIGSSNGYYMFRMAAKNPLFVLGLEPQSAFYYQYLAVQKFLGRENVFCLPVAHEHLPPMDGFFDLVFCMGVLYHRRSPVDMLKDIHKSLKPSGHIVLENLVLQGRNNLCLFPKDRYAKMRNVYFIPDLLAMESWLVRAGFKDVRILDVTRTTSAEQRKTDWIQTESLTDFLDPDEPDKTVEGYPGPVRAVFMAKAG
ncbi:MAG: tRNA 5-methoxyuridine(34)/uridine 5-oxyacetic acid(34) synthase CmoB [Desulfotignum sp.]